MSGFENLKKRIEYRGGARQVDRMIEDKERSLSKALLYSYQSATAILDGKEFRCLINPNKISMEADDKMLSMPYEDICLNKEKPDGAITSSGKEPTGIECGKVIEWKENGTHWIVYSQYLQEIAYFRGLMRQCEDEPIEINGQKFWFYLKGPSETGIEWQKTKNFIFNELNYNIEIYISNTTVTNEFFQRFKKCKVLGQQYEVQAVDRLSTKGILTVYLKEDYTNEWAPDQNLEIQTEPYITGPAQVYPYDIIEYQVFNVNGGKWLLEGAGAKIKKDNGNIVTIEITQGRSGQIKLVYWLDSGENIVYDISILSL